MMNRAFKWFEMNGVDCMANAGVSVLAGLLAHSTVEYGKSCKVAE